MRADFTVSPQQWEAISAPLEPAVVIAGAGSGKTSVMAARVVYLVATGQVTPDQVLGLTFTTKAAHELMLRIRGALDAAGHGPPAPGSADAEDVLEPLVATYNAYASSLLTQHGLRLGHEPDTRVMADASRYQLAARVIERHTGRVDLLSDSPKHVIDYILKLDGALSEHLVSPDDLRRLRRRRAGPLFAAGLADAAAPCWPRSRAPSPAAPRRWPWSGSTAPSRRRTASWTSPTRSRSPRGWPPSTRWSAGSSATSTPWCCSTSTKTPPSPRRRC